MYRNVLEGASSGSSMCRVSSMPVLLRRVTVATCQLCGTSPQCSSVLSAGGCKGGIPGNRPYGEAGCMGSPLGCCGAPSTVPGA
eukprot:2663396-Prorocentrum_lima.AAC.1